MTIPVVISALRSRAGFILDCDSPCVRLTAREVPRKTGRRARFVWLRTNGSLRALGLAQPEHGRDTTRALKPFEEGNGHGMRHSLQRFSFAQPSAFLLSGWIALAHCGGSGSAAVSRDAGPRESGSASGSGGSGGSSGGGGSSSSGNSSGSGDVDGISRHRPAPTQEKCSRRLVGDPQLHGERHGHHPTRCIGNSVAQTRNHSRGMRGAARSLPAAHPR